MFETESPYQYVRVIERADGWRVLQMNEGVVSHSMYHPNAVFTGGSWDYFALAPFFRPAPHDPLRDPTRWAMIGAAAGTTPRLIKALYPRAFIDGVEIDPDVVEIGRRYFGAEDDRYRVEVQDGRAWIGRTTNHYDVIMVDAYRQPYIPFELTTHEFFATVRDHLRKDGVVAMNVAQAPGDLRLVNALAASLRSVFPSVFRISQAGGGVGVLLVAAPRKVTLQDFDTNVLHTHPLLRQLAHRARGNMDTTFDPGLLLTDDRAPVERLIDTMIFRYIVRSYGNAG